MTVWRWLTWGLLALVLLVPLGFMPLDVAESFKVPSETSIVILAGLFAVAAAWERVLAGQLPVGLGSPARRVLVGLGGWVGLSCALGIAPAGSWGYAGSVLAYGLYGFALLGWLEAGGDRRWVLGLLGVVLGFEALVQVLQLRGFDFYGVGDRLWPYWRGYLRVLGAQGAGHVPFGTLGNPNYMGELLALLLPVQIGWVLSLVAVRQRLVGTLLLALPGLLTLATACRAAALGLATVGPLAALAVFGRRALSPRWWAGIVVVLAALVGLGGSKLLVKIQGTSLLGTSLFSRFVNWHAAFEIWRDHPVLGTGLGGFKLLSIGKLAQAFPGGLPEAASHDRLFEAHNEAVQLLAELGLVGVLLIVLAFGLWFHEARTNESLPPALRLGLVWGVGALLVASCFGFPLHIPLTALVLTTVLALGLARPREAGPVVSWRWVPALGVSLAVAAVVRWGALPLFAADRAQYLGDQAADAGDYAAADRYYAAAIRDSRFKGIVVQHALVALYLEKRYRDVLALYDAHVHDGLGMDAMTVRADALAMLGRRDEAIAAYHAVVHYYAPFHPNHKRALVQLRWLGAR